MTAVPVGCWKIVCDVCGSNPIERTDFTGFGPTPSDAREYILDDLDGLPWLEVRGLDICGEHAEWSHDDDPTHRSCESCGTFPPDEVLYAGNCPRCWDAALTEVPA